MQFKVTFEATGFTNSKGLVGQTCTEHEAKGFTEVSLAEETFPKNVLAVLGGRIAEDDEQGAKDIHVFVCVDLLVEANSGEAAERLAPPEDLLTKISDLMSSGFDLDLEAHSWEVTEVEDIRGVQSKVYETGSDDTFWNSQVIREGERFSVHVYDADGDRRAEREASFSDQALAISFADSSVSRPFQRAAARVEALPRLQQQAGAAYTLHQIATKALHQTAGDPMHVDWAQVHQDVWAKAVGQDKQPATAILEAIKRHSPGAVTAEQIAAVDALAESRKVQKVNISGENVTRLMSMIFFKIEASEIEEVVSRLTSVHSEAAAASEGFEYQMRGVGCITDETLVNAEFVGKSVGEVQAMLQVALDQDNGADGKMPDYESPSP